MAAIDSLSSCAPQAKAHPPPPIAHAPTPMGVSSMSLLPRRFFCISSTIAKVASLREENRRGHRLRPERAGGGHSARASRVRGDGPRVRGDARRRGAIGRIDTAGLRARRVLVGAPDGGYIAVFRTVPSGGPRAGVGPPRRTARASLGRWDGGPAGGVGGWDGEGARGGWGVVAEIFRAAGPRLAGAAARRARTGMERPAASAAD